MEAEIRQALAQKNYPFALALADQWLEQTPNSAVAHYLSAWTRDVEGLETDALVHYEKALELGLTGEDRRGALLGAGSTCRNLGQLGRSEEILRRGIQEYGEVSEFCAFLALTLYSAGRYKESISTLLKLLADSATDVHIKRYDRALRNYAADPDRK